MISPLLYISKLKSLESDLTNSRSKTRVLGTEKDPAQQPIQKYRRDFMFVENQTITLTHPVRDGTFGPTVTHR